MLNSRLITLQRSVRFFLAALFWIPVTFFSLLLVKNTLPYFSLSQEFSFIQERAILFARSFYKYSFYIHIFAGMLCISTALVQFSSFIIKKRKKIHTWSGRVYVIAVLLLGAPTGLYMSFFAKGSYWERVLFMFMAIYWFYTTLQGFTAILKKNVLSHKVWMVRSYSMAMTAVTFRVYYILLYYFGVDLLRNYEVSLWMSVVGNMLVAEFLIFRKSRAYLKTFIT